MIRAVRIISRQVPIRVTLHVPDGRLLRLVMSLVSVTRVEGWTQAPPAAPGQPNIGACMGRLSELLAETDLALAKSGSVTLECAWFRVPAVVLYRVAWPTWLVARRLVRVPHVAMPNLLAGKRVYPELLQSAATPEGLARAALELLRSSDARQAMVAELERVRSALGSGGAYRRAAEAIVRLLVELRWNGPPPTGTAAE
jgi:lipid A disaccharide synthetase